MIVWESNLSSNELTKTLFFYTVQGLDKTL